MLKGERELMRRLNATKRLPKVTGERWGNEDVRLNAARVPVRTGRLRGSFRVKSATARAVRVGGHFTAYFIDKGTKPHTIPKRKRGRRVLRFEAGGRTVFARSVHHRGYRARPFRRRAAEDALRRAKMPAILVELWNKAA